MRRSKVAAQIQVLVQMRYVLAITIEHQRFLFARKQAGTDAPFACLTPAWMINLRIYVCVEAVFTRCSHVPADQETC